MLNVKTPAYVIDETLLIKNLEVLKSIMDKTNCKIILAQKAFANFYYYPLISKYLAGSTASGLYEAKLAHEEMGKEVHVYSPAFSYDEMKEIVNIADFIVFNSFNQLNKHKDIVENSGRNIKKMIRVNPEYAEVEFEIYNPAGKFSRFGERAELFEKNSLNGIDGIHFHTMCEQNSDVLERTLEVFEKKFGKYLHKLKYVNLGGGHHITRDDYDIEKLIKLINHIQDTYSVKVYLEPGEAIALNTGFLVSSVLDIFHNEMDIGILDTSAACHMPDVLEVPYTPIIINASKFGEKKFNYRFGGATCLAGDIIGDYSFDKKLSIGDKLIFTDMAHYTTVKNNTFNGVPLPAIYNYSIDKKLELIKEFGYEDFKNRLS